MPKKKPIQKSVPNYCFSKMRFFSITYMDGKHVLEIGKSEFPRMFMYNLHQEVNGVW